jgi:S-adenosylmethionine:tRNA ribosyltransferase-isomerase
MIAASKPVQRPSDAKLMVIHADGHISHRARAVLVTFLRPTDLVIANDAATLPASLQGLHLQSGKRVEVRLAGRRSFNDVQHYMAIVFGEGDFRTRTEDRPPPPGLNSGDRFLFGSLSATLTKMLDHPRLISLRFEGLPEQIWAGLAHQGRPIQYAHVEDPLAMWDVWTSIASLPVAFEPPSAGFVLSWQLLAAIRDQGAKFATLTHAAGISSTGDPELDRRLPFDEPYFIPSATANAVRRARNSRGRIIAIGTTVARALEHAAVEDCGSVHAGAGIATLRIGPASKLRVTDAILTGTHEPNTTHYQMLRAFASDSVLRRASHELSSHSYRTHEFGDSVLVERALDRLSQPKSIELIRPSETARRW